MIFGRDLDRLILDRVEAGEEDGVDQMLRLREACWIVLLLRCPFLELQWRLVL